MGAHQTHIMRQKVTSMIIPYTIISQYFVLNFVAFSRELRKLNSKKSDALVVRTSSRADVQTYLPYEVHQNFQSVFLSVCEVVQPPPPPGSLYGVLTSKASTILCA